jgi:hypothetical protein
LAVDPQIISSKSYIRLIIYPVHICCLNHQPHAFPHFSLKTAGKRPKVKVILGGAPVTEEFARQIGADGFAPDASWAATLARSLVSH